MIVLLSMVKRVVVVTLNVLVELCSINVCCVEPSTVDLSAVIRLTVLEPLINGMTVLTESGVVTTIVKPSDVESVLEIIGVVELTVVTGFVVKSSGVEVTAVVTIGAKTK